MRASILRQTDPQGEPINPDTTGTWTNNQDPITGEIVRVWQPLADQPDNIDTGEYDPTFGTIKCLARGIVDGGIRVAGTTERFGDTYENIDFVKMWVPAFTLITKRDRITNISDRHGRILWRDEEFESSTNAPKATVFNVNGVTPLFDAFNKHTETFILLERAEV